MDKAMHCIAVQTFAPALHLYTPSHPTRAHCLLCPPLPPHHPPLPIRVVETDHGAFVLLNVYVPNAGDRPARARLDLKLSFLRALKARMDELVAGGREVSGCVFTQPAGYLQTPQYATTL
jgi:hypothetical protein